MRCTERTTLRIDNNLKTRIRLLAIKNNFSMNKSLSIYQNQVIDLMQKDMKKIMNLKWKEEKYYGNKNRKTY